VEDFEKTMLMLDLISAKRSRCAALRNFAAKHYTRANGWKTGGRDGLLSKKGRGVATVFGSRKDCEKPKSAEVQSEANSSI